jgi:hypothetical protein
MPLQQQLSVRAVAPFVCLAFIVGDVSASPQAPEWELGQNAVANADPHRARRIAPASLATIATWIGNYLRISGIAELPNVEHAPASRITTIRHKRFRSNGRPETVEVDQVSPRDVIGVYDDSTRTIYLPMTWTGQSPAEMSMLVHHMVHHFQSLAGQKFDCAWERERAAYAAQERWLRLHGTNLWSAFEIDSAIFLLSSEYICR